MGYWIIWFIGIIITIATRILIKRDLYAYENFKEERTIINLLMIICFVIVGGILIAKISCYEIVFVCNSYHEIVCVVLLMILFACVVYVIIRSVFLGVDSVEILVREEKTEALFVVSFILSIVVWSIPIYNYDQNYASNIEYITQTIVESKQERQLLYFCNIPVQEVSGKISGSSFLGNGSISGQIETSDNLSYWYLNQNGDGVYDSASTSASKMVFIDDNQSPYVEIVVYSIQYITKNHNNGTEETFNHKTWTEYTFYLPKTIMQYNLN
jgi:hypothetical protein